MSTTLEPSFLLAVIRMNEFKRQPMVAVQAALLRMSLDGLDFTAADLPGEVTNGSKHIAGAATGALVAQGLLIVVDRIKSPDPKAKGRKLDVLRMAAGKRSTILTWLARQDLPVPVAGQQMALI